MLATLKRTFDTCPEPVLITDAKIRIAYVNPAWEKLTKYTLNEVKGKNPRVLQSGKTPKIVYKKLWKALSSGQGFQTEDVVDKRKTGREYSIHSAIYPILQNGKAQYYVQIQHDISRRKLAEQNKRSLLSLVAHELKTPITTTKFLTEAFRIKYRKKYGEKGLEELQDLTLIHQQIARLARLVDDILNLGRLETNKLKLRLEPVELRALVGGVVIQIQSIISHPITVNGATKYPIMADSDQLRQVITNLLNNAIKYSAADRPIKIQIEEDNHRAIVSVQDYGPGIPKKQQTRIFEQFYQVSERTGEGFGLGLYLSKQIIQRHKGKIWVDSKVGKGSTFFFSLPFYNGLSKI